MKKLDLKALAPNASAWELVPGKFYMVVLRDEMVSCAALETLREYLASKGIQGIFIAPSPSAEIAVFELETKEELVAVVAPPKPTRKVVSIRPVAGKRFVTKEEWEAAEDATEGDTHFDPCECFCEGAVNAVPLDDVVERDGAVGEAAVLGVLAADRAPTAAGEGAEVATAVVVNTETGRFSSAAPNSSSPPAEDGDGCYDCGATTGPHSLTCEVHIDAMERAQREAEEAEAGRAMHRGEWTNDDGGA